MQIRRFLKDYAVLLSCFILALAMYVGLYAFLLKKGMAAIIQIDPLKGISTERYLPVYHNFQVFSADWTGTIAHGLAPIHNLDRLVRPMRWPKDRVIALTSEELQETADQFAALTPEEMQEMAEHMTADELNQLMVFMKRHRPIETHE